MLKQNYGEASPNKEPPYGFLKSATEELQKNLIKVECDLRSFFNRFEKSIDALS